MPDSDADTELPAAKKRRTEAAAPEGPPGEAVAAVVVAEADEADDERRLVAESIESMGYLPTDPYTVGGYVYVMQSPNDPDLCKVGQSASWLQRLRDARTFAPRIRCMFTAWCCVPERAERAIHRRLAEQRHRVGDGIGAQEWFACTSLKSVVQCVVDVVTDVNAEHAAVIVARNTQHAG